MASSKRVKRVYICPTCKGNGYVKVACIYEKEDMVHQCWDCESQGEIYDYENEDLAWRRDVDTLMIDDTDKAYIAGLFDGEGSIHIRRGLEKKKKHKGKPGYRYSNSLRLSMEITMTDRSVLTWLHGVVGVGTLTPKKVKGKRVDGTPYLKQWRWRCTFRDAYYVCCLIWPFAHTKLPKIQQVIEHYTTIALKDNVISLDEYREVQKNVR